MQPPSGEPPGTPPFDPRVFEPRPAGPRPVDPPRLEPHAFGAQAFEPHAFEPPSSERRPDGVSRMTAVLVGALLLLGAAGGVYLWWQQRAAPAPAAPVPVAAAPAPQVAPPPEAAEPVIQHPIEVPAEAATRESAAPAGPDEAMTRALTELLGSKAVNLSLQTDGFVRRVVATVDNLGRVHAPPQRWPVVPSPGRFAVQRSGDAELVSPANAARYEPFVALVTSVDARRAAALYKAHYPQYQAAYRELGYPRGYFNDRLVEVIDLMLATPEPSAPPALRLTEVKGPIAADRPWVRYEFADPKLEALPAGSKILLRMSPEQARRLKAQLRSFRDAVASTPARN